MRPRRQRLHGRAAAEVRRRRRRIPCRHRPNNDKRRNSAPKARTNARCEFRAQCTTSSSRACSHRPSAPRAAGGGDRYETSVVGAPHCRAWSIATLSAGQDAAQAPPSPDFKVVAALKQNLAESAKKIAMYEWIRDDVDQPRAKRSRASRNRVFYGADGKMTQNANGRARGGGACGGRGGRGGRVKENIIESKNDYMRIHRRRLCRSTSTSRPTPRRFRRPRMRQAPRVPPPQAGKVRVEFKDFVLPGDSDGHRRRRQGAPVAGRIATYLEKKDDAVNVADVLVSFGKLTDATGYNVKTTLAAKAKNITVVIENSADCSARKVTTSICARTSRA